MSDRRVVADRLHRRPDGKLVAITLCQADDVRGFKAGMDIMVDGEVARVRLVNVSDGILVIHRPWWWRLWNWIAGVFS